MESLREVGVIFAGVYFAYLAANYTLMRIIKFVEGRRRGAALAVLAQFQQQQAQAAAKAGKSGTRKDSPPKPIDAS